MPKFRSDSITAFFSNLPRALLLTILAIVATPAHALFTQCPPTGKSPGCAILITLVAGDRVNLPAFQVDPSIRPFDGADGALIGFINQANRPVDRVELSGVPGIRSFKGNGIAIGEYAGPEVKFSNWMAGSGTVLFTRDLAKGESTWFTLKDVSPSKIRALFPFTTYPPALEKMSEADKRHQLRCIATRDGDLSALETAREGFLDPLEMCENDRGEAAHNILKIAFTYPPKYWRRFLTMTDPSLLGRLNNLRLAHLMKIRPDDDYLDQIEALLKKGSFPQEDEGFSWHAVKQLMAYFPRRTDSAPTGIEGEKAIALQARMARIITELILPTAPASEGPQASWLGLINMPEPQASAALEILHRKYGDLSIPGVRSPIEAALSVRAPSTLIRSMIRADLLRPNDKGAWEYAARDARLDILQMLLDTRQIPPASAWSAAIVPRERKGDFRALDILLDAYRPPLQSDDAVIALRNLLLLDGNVSEDQKWQRVDRMLTMGADINRVFSEADVGLRQSFYLYFVLRDQPELAKKLIARGLSVTAPMPPSGDNLLLNYLAVPMRTDPNNATLRQDVIEAMLKQENIINRYGKKLQTFPLYLAMGMSNKLAKGLIELGANVNAKDIGGRTMLMIAAAQGEFNIVKFLLNEGADINHISDAGVTALAYSQCYENKEIEVFLHEKGARSEGLKKCTDLLAALRKSAPLSRASH